MNEHESNIADERVYYRMRNMVGRVTLNRGDDSRGVQHHQIEGYLGEIRDGVHRIQDHGFSSMPLPGAEAIVLYDGGQRSRGTIIAVGHSKYRPRDLKPGETHFYMIDGADAKGEGGKVRSILKGMLGWLTELPGKTIKIGSAEDTVTVSTAGKTISLSAGETINITGATGDVVVNGISLVHHTHPGTGPPQ